MFSIIEKNFLMLYLLAFLPLIFAVPPVDFRRSFNNNGQNTYLTYDNYGNVIPMPFPGSPDTVIQQRFPNNYRHYPSYPIQFKLRHPEQRITDDDADDFTVFLNEDLVNNYEPQWYLEMTRKAKEQADSERSLSVGSVDEESLSDHLNSLSISSTDDGDIVVEPLIKKQKSASRIKEKERQISTEEKYDLIKARFTDNKMQSSRSRYLDSSDTSAIGRNAAHSDEITDEPEEMHLEMNYDTPSIDQSTTKKSGDPRKERKKREQQRKREKKQLELAEQALKRKQLEAEENERKRLEYLTRIAGMPKKQDEVIEPKEEIDSVEDSEIPMEQEVVEPEEAAKISYEEAIKESKFVVRTFADYEKEIFAIPSYLDYISSSLKPDTRTRIKSLFDQTRRKDPQPMFKTSDYLSVLAYNDSEESDAFNEVASVYFMAKTISDEDLEIANNLNENFNSFLKSIEKLKISAEEAQNAQISGASATNNKGKRKSASTRKGVKIMIFGEYYLLDTKSVTKLTTLIMKIKPHLELFKHTLLFQYSVVSTFDELAEKFRVPNLRDRFPLLKPIEENMNKTRYVVAKLDSFRKIFETMVSNNVVKRTVILE